MTAFTGDCDGAVVDFNKAFLNCEAESRPRDSALLAGRSVKPLEYPWQIGLVDAGPGVADLDYCHGPLDVKAEQDEPSWRRVLDGIFTEVQQHLFQFDGVGGST